MLGIIEPTYCPECGSILEFGACTDDIWGCEQYELTSDDNPPLNFEQVKNKFGKDPFWIYMFENAGFFKF